jgi:hypothetical protein
LAYAAIHAVADGRAALKYDSSPQGKQVKAIQGTRDAFLRYRVGDYRLLYEILDRHCGTHGPRGPLLARSA